MSTNDLMDVSGFVEQGQEDAAAEIPEAEEVASLEPLWGNVVILMDEPNKVVGEDSVLIVPTMSRRPKLTGKVVAVGPGAVDPVTGVVRQNEVKIGDRVIIGRFMGYGVKVKGVKYQMVEPRAIEAIVGDDITIEQ